MKETDEYTALNARSSPDPDDPDDPATTADDPEGDLLRTIEADNWAHLRATTEMEEIDDRRSTARHVVPRELLEASRPTREHRAVVPRPDDPRWVDAVATLGDDGTIALPEDLRIRLQPQQRIILRVLIDD